MKRTFFARKIIIVLAMIWHIPAAQAEIHLSIGGSHSISNAGLQKIETGAGSAGISIDLGDYFRVGYTYRKELSITSGYEEKASDGTWYYFKNYTQATSNGVDLTLVLYGGDIFTPFIFAGVAIKDYVIYMQDASGNTSDPYKPKSQVSPQGGVGLSIRLNQKFSLKVTYGVSRGQTYLPTSTVGAVTSDPFTQVGISYTL